MLELFQMLLYLLQLLLYLFEFSDTVDLMFLDSFFERLQRYFTLRQADTVVPVNFRTSSRYSFSQAFVNFATYL